MSQSWLYVIGLLFASSYLNTMVGLPFAILINLGVLAAGAYFFKRDFRIDYRSSMLFLSVLIGLRILSLLGIVTRVVNNEMLFGLVLWSWVGTRHILFKIFVLGAVIFNVYQIWTILQTYGVIDISTALFTVAAVLFLAYENR